MRSLLSFIYAICAFGIASAGQIDAVSVDRTSDTHVEIRLSGTEIDRNNVSIFEIPGESARIVVDFKDGNSDLLANGAFGKASISGLPAIRGAKKDNGSVRFVVDLPDGTTLKTHSISADGVVISVNSKGETEESDIPTPRLKPTIAKKPVIVIDAGHGGYDPGAIGKTGLQEKSVTLKAALELKRQLSLTGRYTVVLSRSGDKYVEHADRLKTARANSADLFISIHADATAGQSARGASVYTLADRAKNRSKGIANSQNWIMDVNLAEQSDSVGDILVDLAQRNTLSQSGQFADILIKKLSGKSKLLRNTHRRAGYYVLLAPDVPAILLELGFLSNPDDEKLLKTAAHRKKLMGSVVTAINTYFDRQKS